MNNIETARYSWVIRIIILNSLMYLLLQFSGIEKNIHLIQLITYNFGIVPRQIVENLYIWQFVTYMFIHVDFFHLLFNMYALLIFGMPVEQMWGGKKFLAYYFFAGTGAGLIIFVTNLILGDANYLTPTIGASGAVFGLLLAFGVLYPNVEILIFFIIPIRAKFLVIIYGLLELYMLWKSGGGGTSNISHIGHLGGILFGLVFFFITRARGINFKTKIIKSKIQREINRHEITASIAENNLQSLLNILNKLKNEGKNAITDDEYQLIKYLEIMKNDNKDLCIESDFSSDDQYCLKCKDIEMCLLRKISSTLDKS